MPKCNFLLFAVMAKGYLARCIPRGLIKFTPQSPVRVCRESPSVHVCRKLKPWLPNSLNCISHLAVMQKVGHTGKGTGFNPDREKGHYSAILTSTSSSFISVKFFLYNKRFHWKAKQPIFMQCKCILRKTHRLCQGFFKHFDALCKGLLIF